MGKVKDALGVLSLVVDLIPGPSRVRSLAKCEDKNENIIYASAEGKWPVDVFPHFAVPPDLKYTIKELKIVSEEGTEPAFCATYSIESMPEQEAAEYVTGMISQCDEIVEVCKDHASVRTKFDNRDWFVVGYWSKEKKSGAVEIELSWLSYGSSGESRGGMK